MTKQTVTMRRQRETGIETERGTESTIGSGTETGRTDGTEIEIESGTVTDGCGEKTVHRIANQREEDQEEVNSSRRKWIPWIPALIQMLRGAHGPLVSPNAMRQRPERTPQQQDPCSSRGRTPVPEPS